MSFATSGTVGSSFVSNSIAQSSVTINCSTSPAFNIGNLVIACIATDNLGTTDGDLGDITNVTLRNTSAFASDIVMTKAGQFTNGQGSARAGATVSVYYCISTGNVTTGQTTTLVIDFSGTYASGSPIAFFLSGYSFSAGTSIALETIGTLANDGTDAGSITLSGMGNKEHLVIRAQAIESNTATGTASTNYTNIRTPVGTAGGGAASNIWVQAEYRIVTSTSETTNPTTGNVDQAGLMVAFYELILRQPRPTSIGHPFII